MKLKYAIAQGYRALMGEYRAEHPTVEDAALAFVQDKYGAWIERALETTDYSFIDVDGSSFVVDFPSEDDGKRFQKELGGKVVE